MQSSKNDIVNKVIAEIATKEEAKEVVNWFSSTIEGQQHLSDMLDKDAYILETEPRLGGSLSPTRSDLLYKRIDRKIMDNRLRRTSLIVAAHSYPMLPGQQIEYDKTTGRTTLRDLKHPSHASLWKKNTLYFYDTPLEEVMKILERRFNVEFNLETPEALDYSYTLTTRQSGIEGILKELHKITPVKFHIEGTTITVSL